MQSIQEQVFALLQKSLLSKEPLLEDTFFYSLIEQYAGTPISSVTHVAPPNLIRSLDTNATELLSKGILDYCELHALPRKDYPLANMRNWMITNSRKTTFLPISTSAIGSTAEAGDIPRITAHLLATVEPVIENTIAAKDVLLALDSIQRAFMQISEELPDYLLLGVVVLYLLVFYLRNRIIINQLQEEISTSV